MSMERLRASLADRYLLERELGQGGMATVYLAHDLRHERGVAVKVLRPELAALIGAERFLSEIKTTANLQHPHILPLHDSGEAGGFLFYVMPFVKGETLRDRITREKQLPIRDAVRIATEVAGALDYAHRQGVIHRDIKPENILLPDGSALVADFGIALAVSTAGTRMTETGMSLGTPHYMSPEQAMGERALDARTDVYALGAVLYECLTGDPPFTGSTAQAIVAKVMTEKPVPPSRARDTIPETVEDTVLMALQKLPADRPASAAEFAAMLAGNATASRSAIGTRATSTAMAQSRRLAIGGGLLGLTGIVFGIWGMSRGTAPEPVQSVAFQVSQTGAAAPYLGSDIRATIALSPDGATMAYAGARDGQPIIVVRELGSLEARALPGTEKAHDLTFSPDGRWIAFRQGSALRRVALSGTPPVDITEIGTSPAIYGITWMPSDTIYYLIEASHKLFKVPADGNGPVITMPLPDSIGLLSELAPLPGTPWLLASEMHDIGGTTEFVAFSTRTGEVRRLGISGVAARMLPDGRHILVGKRGGIVTVAAFDARHLRIIGPEIPVLEGIQSTVLGLPSLAVSAAGTIAYVTGTEEDRTIVEVSRTGKETVVVADPANYKDPRWSPDGTRIAVERVDGETGDIWIVDLRSGTRSRLTSGSENLYPLWMPDGRRIVFTSRRSGLAGLWWQPVDGSGSPEPLDPGSEGALRFPHAITADGHTLLFRTNTADNGFDLGAMQLGDSGAIRTVLASKDNEGSPVLSRDNRWMAYVSDASGTNEVYVTPWPNVGRRAQISSGGGQEPMWNPRGGELFYRSGEAMVAASLTERDGLLAPVTRDTLFTGSYVQQPRWPEYDVSADGQRFLMIKRGTSRQEIVVITDWFPRALAALALGGGR